MCQKKKGVIRTPWLKELFKRKVINEDGSPGPNAEHYTDGVGTLRLKIEKLTWYKTPWRWWREKMRWANWVSQGKTGENEWGSFFLRWIAIAVITLIAMAIAAHYNSGSFKF